MVILPQYTVGAVLLFSVRSCYFNWLGAASKLDNPNPLGFADRAEGKNGWSRSLGFSCLRLPREFSLYKKSALFEDTSVKESSGKMNQSMRMVGSGGASGLATIIEKLPVFRKVIGWFKGNDLNTDNHLFRLHYLVSTMNR